MEPMLEVIDIPYSKKGDPAQDQKLLQPFTYIAQIPGKNIRGKLSRAFNYWLDIPKAKVDAIGIIIELLHNASLLLDDIEDKSTLRRGIPVAHTIFGVPSTINAANYVIFIALEKVLALDHPEATQVYAEQLLELHRGQGMEIYWRDNFTCPTEEEYVKMTIGKTGGLFMLAIRLMQIFSANKTDFTRLAEILGLSFQIIDDYKNLTSKTSFNNKSFCEDLTEGKFSFPIIHALRSYPNDNQIINILRQRTREEEVKKYCVTLLKKFGSFDYTQKKLRQLETDARQEVIKLGGNPEMDNIIDLIFNFI